MKFVALVPQRESNIKTVLGAINQLPTLKDGVDILGAQTTAEKHADLPVLFEDLLMDEEAGLGIDLAGTRHTFQYTRHALTQAVSRIKPEGTVGVAGYFAACPPDLRAENFNFWHEFYYGPDATDIVKNDVMLRTRFGEDGLAIIRAVVSQSYVPIDDAPLMRQFLSVVPDGAHVRNARGDLKSRFDVIWPTMKKVLVRGEPIFVAVRLLNSETGVSSVRLEPMVYSTQSRTAIIIPAGKDVSIRHIGEAGDRLIKAFTVTQDAIDPFVEMLNQAYSDLMIDRFETVDQMLECVKRAFTFNESTMKKIQENLAGNARSDLIDAITRTADGLPIEDGEELQKAAGVVTMRGWKYIERFKEEQ